MGRNRRLLSLIALLAAPALASNAGLHAAEAAPPTAEKTKPAALNVSGTGLLRDRELRHSLLLLLGEQRAATFNANAIEDAAMLLVSALSEDGFQEPTIEIDATLVDGTVRHLLFDATLETGLPRPLEARRVEFAVRRGARWHITGVAFNGLTSLPEEVAESYFHRKSMGFLGGQANAYSPAHVDRAARALHDDLLRRGHTEAEVEATVETVDKETGAVALRVDVTEGARWQVTEVRFEGADAAAVPLPPTTAWIGQPWSTALAEEIREAVRREYYTKGYPDVSIGAVASPGPTHAARRDASVAVAVQPGPRVTVGEVRFEGNAVTRESLLQRRVRARPGDPLNPLTLARSRYRISRLGAFDSVDLRYEPADGAVRDPVFTLKESRRHEANLLFGYGSYEQVRGGIELRQGNLFGRAHQSLLQVVQSMKSSSVDYTYSVPDLLGESIDGTARLFGLQRQERAFKREEFGTSVTLKRPIRWLHAEGTAGYTFQVLRNKHNELATEATDQAQLNVASIDFGLSGDHRDNPFRPRRGYRWFAKAELASRGLGGDSDYQRLEMGVAYHTSWGQRRWIHLGLTHGVITTFGTTDATLPVNKRFFPGGDNSIRGYQKGEAAPRDVDGQFLGAKSYILLNTELEQELTSNWSLVLFLDALGSAAQLRDYPSAAQLYTVGLGLRYQTLIGPVRLEYGHNLNPRSDDPRGTWHLSIGYPF
jgi:outer membrane protein assembly complex protein YaeT